MAEVKKEAMIAIMNQGGGPMQVSTGVVKPGQSIEVPESEATVLCKYRHIVLASTVVKGINEVDTLRKENVKLKAQVAELEAKVGDFMGAENKKELDAVKEKYAPKES